MSNFVKLNPSQVEKKVNFIRDYAIARNAASGSEFDSNANVSCKNLSTMASELDKDVMIQVRRALMHDKITELFGKRQADRYIEQIEKHEIYQNDESHILPYCASISMYPFLLEGLTQLGGESKAPLHLESFCGSFVNLVFAVSSQINGAVATVEFLNVFNYFCEKDYGQDYLLTHRREVSEHFQHIVYALNQPAAARNYQSVFWNISLFDRYYLEGLFENFRFPDGSVINFDNVMRLQKFFMEWFNKERTKALLTFPVVTASLLVDGKGPLDYEFKSFLAKELSMGNSFFIYESDSIDSLSSCCRLTNKLREDYNQFSYTLGAGGVMTGSINVITMNINRMVQQHIDIRERVKELHQYHFAWRKILEDFQQKGMMPIYDAHFIELSKQFSTIGINGLVEAAESQHIHPDNNDAYRNFVASILKPIYEENQRARKHYQCQFNTEFVPAENLGVKNAKWDSASGLAVSRNCYNSYFFPVERDDISLLEKFVLHGRDFTRYLDGGSALHLNLEEYPSAEQYEKLMDIAAVCGCNYFTTNVKVTICNVCGNIDKRTLSHCPHCGSLDVDYGTRIIGYLKRISSFSAERQKEALKRYYQSPTLN